MEQSHPEIEHKEKINSNNEYLIWDDDNKWHPDYWWKWGVIWVVVTFSASILGEYTGSLYQEWFVDLVPANINSNMPFLTGDMIIFAFISILVLSSSQWLVLKYHIEDAYQWIFYSIGGYIAGMILYVFIVNSIFFKSEFPDSSLFYFVYFLISLIVTITATLIQVLLIRNWFYRARTWVLIVVIGQVFQILMMWGVSTGAQYGGGAFVAIFPSIDLIARNLPIFFSAFAMMYMLQREYEIDAEYRGIIEIAE